MAPSTIPSRIEPLGPRRERRQRLKALRTAFSGVDTEYPLVDGGTRRRTYLDSAASTLRLEPAAAIVRQALDHYANTHSQLHFGARVMTDLYRRAHEIVGDFVGAPDDWTVVFTGSGVTGGLNRMARVLSGQRPDRGVVITTMMEHHANDLPHRKHAEEVVHVPLEHDADGEAGRVDMEALRAAIDEHADRLNYVAVTAASNVTGIINPVHEIARLAHDAGALCVVDAAQSAAHLPMNVAGDGAGEALDVVCLSGHKIYAPGSPGVVVARKDLFAGREPEEVGGGIVDFVDTDRYGITDALPEREETGTPNLPGALLLAATLYLLGRVGMDVIEADERRLTRHALDRLSDVDGLRIYGSHRLEVAERIGVVTFNLDALPHGLVTAALNDHFGIAMRNECFCAQPFVRQLLGISDRRGRAPDGCADRSRSAGPGSGGNAGGSDETTGAGCATAGDGAPRRQPGMVRLSLGLYNTEADVDRAADALADLAARPDAYREQYRPAGDGSGDWVHRDFEFAPRTAFTLEGAVDDWLRDADRQ
jgi:selenocysteine lyase/cysteine desulfurase